MMVRRTIFGLGAAMIGIASAAAHDDLERTIADEDRQFCERFGLRSDSAAFTACSRELAIVRQNQADRDRAADQGIL